MSYFGKMLHLIRGEDKLAQKDAEIAQKDAEIDRLMQLLSQRDAELDQKNVELDQKDTEIDRLMQLLSERDADLAQTKLQFVELQKCNHDLTVVEPVDIQVKLGEMFESWKSIPCDAGTGYISSGSLKELHTKICIATEQIKDPIMGLFHNTYGMNSNYNGHTRWSMCATAILFTVADVYRLATCMPSHEPGIVGCDCSPSTNSIHNFSLYPVKWVKIGSINKGISLKTLIKYINNVSGYTGHTYHSGMNNVCINSAEKQAMNVTKSVVDLAM